MATVSDLLRRAERALPSDLAEIVREAFDATPSAMSQAAKEAQESFLAFERFIDPTMKVNWHHAVVADHLEQVARGEIQRLMVLEPPRHGKTKQCSHDFPAWLLGRQDEAIVACSYNATKATEEAGQVQRLIASARYREVFPKAAIPRRSNAQAGHRQGSDKFSIIDRPRANYRAVGIEGSLTGFDKTIGIVDDPVKDQKEALSPKKKDAVWDWWNSVYRYRDSNVIAGPAGIRDILVMTPWAEDDLHGRLLENESDWHVLRLPAFLTEASKPDADPDDPREPHEVLWALAKTMPQLLELQRQSPDKFQALFQLRPSSKGGDLFKRAHFANRYEDLRDVPLRGHWFVSVDAAFRDSPTSSQVAIQVWCLDYDAKRAYLVEASSAHRSFTATCQSIRTLLARYPHISEVLVEAKANGDAIIDTLKTEVSQLVVGYNPKGSKMARAAAISSWVEQMCVWLPRTASWLEEAFLGPVCSFPRGKVNDPVDAMSQALVRLANSPLAGQDAWTALMRRR